MSLLMIARKLLGRLAYFAHNVLGMFPLLAISLALGAFTVLVLIPRHVIYLLLFIIALTTVFFVMNPAMVTYSNHGMIHLGFVYATERDQWPPEDPYFAGTPLHYPWAYHALVGGISSLLQVAPSWVFAGTNLLALAITIIAVAGLSKILDGDETTANSAIIVTVLAPTFLGNGAGAIFWPLSPVHDEAFWRWNGLPPVEKYLSVSGMPLGMAIGLICIWKLFAIIKRGTWNVLDMSLICLSVSSLGYLYPPVWLSTCIVAAVCTAIALRAGLRSMAVALIGTLVIGNLAVVPYLRDLTSGRSQGQTVRLLQEPRVYGYHLLHIAFILLPLWLLIAIRRQSLMEQLRRSWVHRAALVSGILLLLTFVLLYAPGDTGYKFRLMAIFCLAPLAAPGVKLIYDRSKAALVLILAIQLAPFCYTLHSKSPWGWGTVAEPCHWERTLLRHDNPEEDRLYEWIRANTPRAAILVDNKPYLPVFAQRSLFIARNSNWKPEDWWTRRDGWTYKVNDWLERSNGHSVDEIQRRNGIVDALYGETDSPHGESIVQELGEITKDRPVFVVGRNESEKARLRQRSFLRKVAEQSDWAVYALEWDKNKN